MDWIVIRQEYETTDISLKELSAKHSVSEGTMRSRKNREKWQRSASNATDNATQRTKQRATKKKDVATKGKATKGKPKTKATNNKTTDIEISPALTEMQKLFCLYFVKNRNATLSAIKAGYAKESAHVQGSCLLRIIKVANEIKRLKGSLIQDLYLDARDVLEVYVKIALADPTDYFEFGTYKQFVYVEGQRVAGPDGQYQEEDINFVRIKNSEEIDGSMISEIKQGKEGISIKFHDKHKALDVLREYFDLTPDQHKRKMEDANLELSKRRVDVTEAELELRKKENERKDF